MASTTNTTEQPRSHQKYNMFCKLLNVSSEPVVTFSLETGNCQEHDLVSNYILNWVLLLFLYSLALISLLIATAIACDDYFVPSLDVISEKLNLSGAVAGATFMAAGSSAPEFFSSCISIGFETDIGIGTITGSAIFNLLVIVACTALYVKKDLKLDWRPVARDSVFYGISICVFIIAVWDTIWSWWEAAIMVSIYVAYILAMVFDEELMASLTRMENLFSNTKPSSIKPICRGVTFERVASTRSDNPWVLNTTFLNRHRNMSFIFTDDPSMKSAKSMVLTYSVRFSKILTREIQVDPSGKLINEDSPDSFQAEETAQSMVSVKQSCCMRYCSLPLFSPPVLTQSENMKSKCKHAIQYVVQWFIFVLGLPYIIIFTYTIPDCTRKEYKKWYLVTFICSLLWIAAITFGMVKFIVEIGCLIKMHHFVMSIVFLAAGTSIPDMLSSIIVAKEGQGNMAVSNALGSNVFDINIGLGLPVLISIALKEERQESVLATQDRVLFCQKRMAISPHQKFGFILLILVILSLCVIIWQKFRLTRKLGLVFLFLYSAFVAYAFFQQFWCFPRGHIC